MPWRKGDFVAQRNKNMKHKKEKKGGTQKIFKTLSWSADSGDWPIMTEPSRDFFFLFFYVLPLVLGSKALELLFLFLWFFVGCLGTAASQTAVLRTFSEIKACIGRYKLLLAFSNQKKKFLTAKPWFFSGEKRAAWVAFLLESEAGIILISSLWMWTDQGTVEVGWDREPCEQWGLLFLQICVTGSEQNLWLAWKTASGSDTQRRPNLFSTSWPQHRQRGGRCSCCVQQGWKAGVGSAKEVLDYN